MAHCRVAARFLGGLAAFQIDAPLETGAMLAPKNDPIAVAFGGALVADDIWILGMQKLKLHVENFAPNSRLLWNAGHRFQVIERANFRPMVVWQMV